MLTTEEVDIFKWAREKEAEARRLLSRYEAEIQKYRAMDGCSLFAKDGPNGTCYYSMYLNEYDEQGNRMRVYLGKQESSTTFQAKMHYFLSTSIKRLRKNLKVLQQIQRDYTIADPNEIQRSGARAYRELPRECFDLADKANVYRWKKRYQTNHHPDEPTRNHPEGLIHETCDHSKTRSKSEVIIYNKLCECGLAFCYEYQKTFDGKYMEPDFVIYSDKYDRFFVWEHLGLLKDPDYLIKTLEKLEHYHRAGFRIGENLIFTVDGMSNEVSTYDVFDQIKVHLAAPPRPERQTRRRATKSSPSSTKSTPPQPAPAKPAAALQTNRQPAPSQAPAQKTVGSTAAARSNGKQPLTQGAVQKMQGQAPAPAWLAAAPQTNRQPAPSQASAQKTAGSAAAARSNGKQPLTQGAVQKMQGQAPAPAWLAAAPQTNRQPAPSQASAQKTAGSAAAARSNGKQPLTQGAVQKTQGRAPAPAKSAAAPQSSRQTAGSTAAARSNGKQPLTQGAVQKTQGRAPAPAKPAAAPQSSRQTAPSQVPAQGTAGSTAGSTAAAPNKGQPAPRK